MKKMKKEERRKREKKREYDGNDLIPSQMIRECIQDQY